MAIRVQPSPGIYKKSHRKLLTLHLLVLVVVELGLRVVRLAPALRGDALGVGVQRARGAVTRVLGAQGPSFVERAYGAFLEERLLACANSVPGYSQRPCFMEGTDFGRGRWKSNLGSSTFSFTRIEQTWILATSYKLSRKNVASCTDHIARIYHCFVRSGNDAAPSTSHVYRVVQHAAATWRTSRKWAKHCFQQADFDQWWLLDTWPQTFPLKVNRTLELNQHKGGQVCCNMLQADLSRKRNRYL